MYVPIEQMPDSARVWIYQSNRGLSEAEIQVISTVLKNFCEQWQVHGTPMQTSFSVDHSRFIILAVNDASNSPSGCSIDSSVHVLKDLEQTLQADFFSRGEVVFCENSRIEAYPLGSLKKLFGEGILHENSVALNTLVQTWGEWRNHNLIKVTDSWLSRYIPKEPVP